jgi:hypothetical protein
MPEDESDDLSGLPDPDAPEPEPLGPPTTEPGSDGQVQGEDAMPGIPREGEEPPTDG